MFGPPGCGARTRSRLKMERTMVDRVAGGPDAARAAAGKAEAITPRRAAALREAVAAENRASVVPQGLLEHRDEGQPGALYDRSL
jgi:hypothetical protein